MSDGKRSVRIDWFDGSLVEDTNPRHSQSNELNVSSSQQKPTNFEKKAIGFKKLREISLLEPPILNLELECRPGFWLLFTSDIQDDFFVLLIKILASVYKSLHQNDQSKLVTMLDNKVMKSDFLKKLEKYVDGLPKVRFSQKSRNSCLWDDPNKFFCDLIEFYKGILLFYSCNKEYLKNFYSLLEVTEISAMKVEENHSEIVSNNVYNSITTLKSQIEKILLKEPVVKPIKEGQTVVKNDMFYYKNMSVFPTSIDFTDIDMLDHIKPNIIDGAYSSAEHYLDLQFKLLREDCFRPLVEGMRQYMKNPSIKKTKNIRVYRRVYIIDMVVARNRVGYVVDLSLCSEELKTYRDDKLFMFGSLLLFKRGNCNTLLLATVLNTSKKNVTVLFESSVPDTIFSEEYFMVESEVYFEPYHRVLSVLQNFNISSLPMQRYIVYANRHTNPPSYLKQNTIYNVKDLTGKNISFRVFGDNWPQANLIGFDESQMDAFKYALTKEFVVIQGPPGTGKTYLGILITKALLDNAPHNNSPILIICYTNHALDQFLEGLLKYTEDIVRLGGQSKSEILKEHNLYNVKMSKSFHATSFNVYKKKKYELSRAYYKIKEINITIGICDCVIISLKDLRRFCQGSVVLELADDRNMLDWLFDSDSSEWSYIEMKPTKLYDVIDYCFSEETVLDMIKELKDAANHADLLSQFGKRALHSINDKIRFFERRIDIIKYYKEKRNELKSMNLVNRKSSVYSMNLDERWAAYFKCVDRVKDYLKQKRATFMGEYDKIAVELDCLKDTLDAEKLKTMKVVGMTTTMAAQRQGLMRKLKSFIVIVEEAAEVLETHILASLTDQCKHLILIGDHQQLQPTSAHYIVGRKYNLQVSLFERMVRNGINSQTLRTQRRMRVNIMNLLVPTIYDDLQCHPRVLNYPSVRGLEDTLYFFKHEIFEDTVEDDSSCSNKYEAAWCVSLANYLRKMDYSPDEITILATYSAQAALITKLSSNYELLEDVQITTVDNFQGEESRIVILSLVRSNKDRNIGFLATANRICVALSRAKEGLYIFGNMSCLRASSPIWRNINKTLQNQKSIGNRLALESDKLLENPCKVKSSLELDLLQFKGNGSAFCNIF